MSIPAGTTRTNTALVVQPGTITPAQCDPSVPTLTVLANPGTGTLPSGTYCCCIQWTGPDGTIYQTPTSTVTLTAAGELYFEAVSIYNAAGGAAGWNTTYSVFIGTSASAMYLQASSQTAESFYQGVPLTTTGPIAMGPSPQLQVFSGIGSRLNVGAVWTNQGLGTWQYSYTIPLTLAVGATVAEKVLTTVGGSGLPGEYSYTVGLTPLTSAQTQAAAAAAITAAEPVAANVTEVLGQPVVGAPMSVSVQSPVSSGTITITSGDDYSAGSGNGPIVLTVPNFSASDISGATGSLVIEPMGTYLRTPAGTSVVPALTVSASLSLAGGTLTATASLTAAQTGSLSLTTPPTNGSAYRWRLLYVDAAGLTTTVSSGNMTVVRP
jgi:hypothetical protein